jgi:small-conductance mechanosensitive channel
MFARLLAISMLTLLALVPSSSTAQLSKTLLPADAAQAPALSDPMTMEEVRELVARLSDKEVRDLLLERLEAVADAEDDAPGAPLLDLLEDSATGVYGTFTEAVAQLPRIPGGFYDGFAKFVADRGAGGTFAFLGVLALAILTGAAVEYGLNRLADRWRRRILEERPETLRQTLGLLLRRAILDFGGVLVFTLVALWMVRWLMPPVRFNVEAAEAVITQPILFARLFAAIARFVAAPRYDWLRLVNLDDRLARFFYRGQIVIGVIIGLNALFIPFLATHGVPVREIRLFFWFNFAVYAYLIYMVIYARHGLTAMLIGREGDATPMERTVARAFPYFGVLMIFLTWFGVEALVYHRQFQFLDGRQHITLFLLLLAPVFDTAVRGLVRHLAPPMKGAGAVAEKAYRSTRRIYIRIGRVLVFGVIVVVIARIWSIDFANIAEAGVGAKAAAKVIEMLIILAIGLLVHQLVTLWIDRKLAAEMTAQGVDLTEEEPGGGEGGGAGGSRLASVLPLLRLTLQAVVITITALIALGNVGIDITPLLAGAGVIGLAIGFGAQKLVADVVSGVFFLIDDAFRTGEYVEVEGTLGTVEKISLRSLQLRHHRGAVHTIPYGEIPKITNYSRDWVIMKLRFTVPFETDLNKVKKIFKQIGSDMMQVPEFAADMLQPFKSQGVLDVDDVGIVIRGKFMAKPGKQFTLRKEIYGRVQKAFEANGIQFARKEVRVKVDGAEPGRELTEDQKQAIAAAASDAAEKTAEPGT